MKRNCRGWKGYRVGRGGYGQREGRQGRDTGREEVLDARQDGDTKEQVGRGESQKRGEGKGLKLTEGLTGSKGR